MFIAPLLPYLPKLQRTRGAGRLASQDSKGEQFLLLGVVDGLVNPGGFDGQSGDDAEVSAAVGLDGTSADAGEFLGKLFALAGELGEVRIHLSADSRW